MKLLTKETCPNCKENFESEKDLENFDVKRNIGKIEKIESQLSEEKPKPEIVEKEIIKEVTKIPSHIPSYKCKDGNCGKQHPNPNYTKKIKGKCTNCGQFTSDLDSECPFCSQKEFDELDEDELSDLGIPEPKESEHEHSHE